jgi:hypothetical protein
MKDIGTPPINDRSNSSIEGFIHDDNIYNNNMFLFPKALLFTEWEMLKE